MNPAISLLTLLTMEGITWLTHRYIMHGFLWYLHEDHHQPRKRFFEKNDLFFVIFAVPSCACIVIGLTSNPVLVAIGLGILYYGIAYFLVHDVLIHRRFKWFDNVNHWYFRGLRKAHKIHHKHQGKHPGECYGMLWVPLHYFKQARRQNSSHQ